MFERHRRLRTTAAMRALVQETQLHSADFIHPIFVIEGEGIKNPIASMPDVYQWSLDRLNEELSDTVDAGVRAVIVFGVVG
ncbi:MAG: porphobilinogen synthase, partial [Bacilli bacterium]